MAEKFISLRNLQFLLYEQFDAAALTKYPYFADHSKETFDMVLETAMRMGRGILFPALSVMDKEPPEFRDGKVFVHPVAALVMKTCVFSMSCRRIGSASKSNSRGGRSAASFSRTNILST